MVGYLEGGKLALGSMWPLGCLDIYF